MATLTLEPCRDLESISRNFARLAAGLAAINGDQIVPGSLPSGAMAGAFLTTAGGAVSGPVSAPAFYQSGVLVATTADLTGYTPTGTAYTKAEADAKYRLISDSYTKAEVDSAIGGAAVPNATTTTAGKVKSAAAVPNTALDGSDLVTTLNALLVALRAAGSLAT